ncbi:S-layer homology domain-containing protein [Alkalihalophilus marmarensis]|uniref:S-layer homology domain-containing protein n=1 Tax=Alkalihalophilus marmarensis TaxID=521377 RepID=UPI002DB8B15D|nr:S-layer homology domain-containing protein [Alkalihalophilus marmarensis]MEC2073433.1 S-layer homology domain-containing protein [Alkalihalophilus marmarensis]
MKQRLSIYLTIILIVTALTPSHAGANNATFSDIDGHWAEEDIEALAEAGIVNGYVDGTFRPNNEITRSEFVKLVVDAFDLKSNDAGARDTYFYADTYTMKNSLHETYHWALPEISIATIRGLIHGTGPNTFSPNVPLTREQLAVIFDNLIYEATPFLLQRLSEAGFPTGYEAHKYKDFDDISEWSVHKVDRLTVIRFIQGYNGYFNPKQPATRGEVAHLINKLLGVADDQGVTTVFSGYYYETLPDEVPYEMREWVDGLDYDNFEEDINDSFVAHSENRTYAAVSRLGSPCDGIQLKSLRDSYGTLTAFFEYTTNHVVPYVCPESIELHVKVVKLPLVDEVEVKINK